MLMLRSALLITIAAATAAAQTLTPEARERMERAHQRLEAEPPDAAKTAEELTRQTAGLRPAEASPHVERRNFIDEHIFSAIEKKGAPHSGLASDQEFLRRAYLDAIGRIPTLEETQKFLRGADSEKRAKLIDELVASEEFVERWSYYFEDLFRAGNRMGYGKNLFHFWIQEWLRLDRPYSEVVTDLLTQGGKSSHSLPGGLYFARDFVKAKDDPDTPDAHDLVNRADAIDEFTVTYGKVLMGVNLGCISCHDGANHLEKVNLWLTDRTREQFFQQASFFGRTRMLMNWENGFQANTEYVVDDVEPGYPTEGESIVRVPRTGGSNEPRFILSNEAARPDALPRDELARLLTGHIQFARATTNRIWAELMGFGIVEPIEDFDLNRYYPDQDIPEGWTVQPSNPELLDDLAKDFQASNFSFKHLIRTIMNSSAYQLSSQFDAEWKPEYASLFNRKFVRMLSPEQLHDSLVTATAVPGSYDSGVDGVQLARQLLDPAHVSEAVGELMRAFGQQTRDEMPTRTPTSSLQAMLMMNSDVVLERVKAEGQSRVAQLLHGVEDDRIDVAQAWRSATGNEPTEQELQRALNRGLVEKLYVATLTRRPVAAEMDVALGALDKDRRQGLENLHWALVNKPEFLFNY